MISRRLLRKSRRPAEPATFFVGLSTLAVLELVMNSNLVGCSMSRLAALAPTGSLLRS